MYQLKKIELDLKTTWKISRNESTHKENFVLGLEDYESEIAPNIRYDEDAKLIEKHFKEINKTSTMNLTWCNAFQCAVNNVLLKKQFSGDLFQALNLPRVDGVKTSFSIPIMDEKDVEDYLKLNSQYKVYKLKVSDAQSFHLLEKVASLTDKPIRIDANEGFKTLDDFLDFQKKISSFNIEFIEQPFASSMVDEYMQLKPLSVFPLIADESLLLDFSGEKFQKMFHGINVKLMKCRGLEQAKKLLEKAKRFELKTMIGCMIESSLGISEAMTLVSLCDYVDLDGALLTSNDPYAHLIQEEDGLLTLTK